MKRILTFVVIILLMSFARAQSKDSNYFSLMVGEPKNDVDAIAQNTGMVFCLSGTCGYEKLSKRYNQESVSNVQKLLKAAYGNDFDCRRKLTEIFFELA